LILTILWHSQEPCSWDLPGTWNSWHKCREGWSLQSTLKEEGDFQRTSCCCMTVPIPILWPACWKPSGKSRFGIIWFSPFWSA
jgi:hypothetical protein